VANAPHRIDVHFHSVPKAYAKALAESALGVHIRIPEWSPDLALKTMDANGIATAITSLSVPGCHLGDDAKARSLSRAVNEECAEFVGQNPARFGCFATLPVPDMDGACAEAIHALDVLKLDGIGLLANYEGMYLGDPAFDPLFDILNQRHAVVAIHPNNHPAGSLIKLRVPGFLMEYLFDTTRAAANLVFSGALDRYPNIKFVLSHAGGTLPFISWRLAEISERQLAVSPFKERFQIPLIEDHEGHVNRDLIFSRLRRFYYDTALAAGPQTLGALRQVADPSRILFGSDWPYCPTEMGGDMVESLDATLTAAEKPAVDRGNALKLFPRFG
jgi:predicted TIM-barrel fold metal-dependent hydrolase